MTSAIISVNNILCFDFYHRRPVSELVCTSYLLGSMLSFKRDCVTCLLAGPSVTSSVNLI